jgi:hypothetical protein
MTVPLRKSIEEQVDGNDPDRKDWRRREATENEVYIKQIRRSHRIEYTIVGTQHGICISTFRVE